MELDKQIKLSHLLLSNRTCRVCNETKDLTDSFYRTRKDRGPVASSFSYECKECTSKRINATRKKKTSSSDWKYPDW
jgi:CRISPR/Cas system-associated protein Cas10 (large subunit of type III CRISPR-Cas system)